MEREKRLPDMIFMSSKASELLECQITEAGACIVTDAQGISIKEASLCAEDMDATVEYRNIV